MTMVTGVSPPGTAMAERLGAAQARVTALRETATAPEARDEALARTSAPTSVADALARLREAAGLGPAASGAGASRDGIGALSSGGAAAFRPTPPPDAEALFGMQIEASDVAAIDRADELATMARFAILQQAGTAALAHMNQQGQSVMRMLA